jgi:transposase
MLSLPPSTRVFVATKPADMRRSFDGLFALVRDFLGEDPLSGHLFVFRNRAGDRLKILWWDRDGLAIWYKRLEEGTFRFPSAGDMARLEMTSDDLQLVLQGIDLAKVKRSNRYQRPAGMTNQQKQIV